jgi:hypothetical protein
MIKGFKGLGLRVYTTGGRFVGLCSKVSRDDPAIARQIPPAPPKLDGGPTLTPTLNEARASQRRGDAAITPLYARCARMMHTTLCA